jgi:hypothetical protein
MKHLLGLILVLSFSIDDIVVTAGAAGVAGEGFNLGDSLGLADDTNDLSGTSSPQQ